MCVINDIKEFAVGGFKTFRKAAKGSYDGESEAVGAIRQEMFSRSSGRGNDVLNLHHDRRMVEHDARLGFNKVILINGQAGTKTAGDQCGHK